MFLNRLLRYAHYGPHCFCSSRYDPLRFVARTHTSRLRTNKRRASMKLHTENKKGQENKPHGVPRVICSENRHWWSTTRGMESKIETTRSFFLSASSMSPQPLCRRRTTSDPHHTFGATEPRVHSYLILHSCFALVTTKLNLRLPG